MSHGAICLEEMQACGPKTWLGGGGNMTTQGPEGHALSSRVGVVLHRPRSPENIGASARAMWNMGLRRLSVVGPLRWDQAAMQRMATREAAHVISGMQVHDSLEAALACFHLVVGTTARQGGLRGPAWSPWKAAERIVALGAQDQVAVVFGPEDRGLSNEELRLCHMVVRIPTAGFASLNLAQAVLVICYELHKAALQREGVRGGVRERLATVAEQEGMYAQLEETLVKLCVIPEGNPQRGMRKVRQFLARAGLRPHEVRMIRGLCRQIDWYANHRVKLALEGKTPGDR